MQQRTNSSRSPGLQAPGLQAPGLQVERSRRRRRLDVTQRLSEMRRAFTEGDSDTPNQ